ncbi:hypothetical protein C7S16_4320 [Burkholderia thailandensis]|uniref:Uncharacterized protein n=1 Tax=Burkholderia thailandensis TaxID=57975 RepID=A0AAW9CSY8_BURTH|nr:hypothetical protein [Burkholderia thailandensis]MDW9252223.1 hypothetical protein [Burkholderia thailandensis]
MFGVAGGRPGRLWRSRRLVPHAAHLTPPREERSGRGFASLSCGAAYHR